MDEIDIREVDSDIIETTATDNQVKNQHFTNIYKDEGWHCLDHRLKGMSDSEILTDSDSDSDFFCRQ